MTLDPTRFGPDFMFGTATASYQIEGAVTEDGRGPSIWDTFSHTPGKVANGDTGDVACDHYHRYAEDIALMSDLGIDAYRFSIAWPRIQPAGSGAVNAAGLDFYDRLVDALLAAGISPLSTLYHWDLPQPLEDAGGWRVRDTAERFAEYAAIVAERLGDRVPRWLTLNEPWVSAFLGYSIGVHAPGAREGEGALKAAHHLLVAHGLGVQALRSAGVQQVGITLDLQPVTPVTDSPEDVAAADRALMNTDLTFTDPVLAGRYPELNESVYADVTDFAFRLDGDLELISAPIDYLGINYYFPMRVRAGDYQESDPSKRVATDLGFEDVPEPGLPRTEMGWPVDPGALTELLVWLRDRYPKLPPIVITENGRASADEVVDGQVHDADRIEYVDAHLSALADAADAGVRVDGYFCWSLLDNFEWAEGYNKRFGIVYTDYETQQRIPKDSFSWYRQVIADHRRAR